MFVKFFTGNYWASKNFTIKEYEESIFTARDNILKAMSPASREVWKCDPPKHKKGN